MESNQHSTLDKLREIKASEDDSALWWMLDEIIGVVEQYQAAQKALAYVGACFEGDEESVTRRLRAALGVAQAWEVKNEDARYVASLIRDVLPPISDASGVVRAALNPAKRPT